MTFWLAMMLFVSWQVIVYVCIFRAIKNQPDDELEHAWLGPDPASTDVAAATSA
jgi:hypothetical protein